MEGKLRDRLTYANVVSTLCLFLLLGGTAVAVDGSLPGQNTVGSADIINGEVTGDDLATNAVGTAKINDRSVKNADLSIGASSSNTIADGGIRGVDVFDGTLTGDDIAEDSLGQVPNAAQADQLDGLDSSDFARSGSEGWSPLSLFTEPESCHYANLGSPHNDAAYFRDRAGVVHLRGMVKAVDGSQALCGFFTFDGSVQADPLPGGYRPANVEVFTITSNNKPARIDMLPHGGLQLAPDYPTWADAKVFFSLDGISYRCAPSGQDGCP